MRIWAAGTYVLLFSDGQSWQTISSQEEPLFPDGYINPRALYVPDDKNLLVSVWSGGGARLYVLDQFNPNNKLMLAEHERFAYCMDGFSINDVFIGSEFTSLEHYNGKRMKMLDAFTGSGFLTGIDHSQNSIFVVGLLASYRGVFIHGSKK